MPLAALTGRLTGLSRRLADALMQKRPAPVPLSDHPAAGGTLFDRLQDVLRLAGECPPGAPGDEIRRAACEMIEADSTQQRRSRRARLLDVVRRVESRRPTGHTAPDHPSPRVLRALSDALGEEFRER